MAENYRAFKPNIEHNVSGLYDDFATQKYGEAQARRAQHIAPVMCWTECYFKIILRPSSTIVHGCTKVAIVYSSNVSFILLNSFSKLPNVVSLSSAKISSLFLKNKSAGLP